MSTVHPAILCLEYTGVSLSLTEIRSTFKGGSQEFLGRYKLLEDHLLDAYTLIVNIQWSILSPKTEFASRH